MTVFKASRKTVLLSWGMFILGQVLLGSGVYVVSETGQVSLLVMQAGLGVPFIIFAILGWTSRLEIGESVIVDVKGYRRRRVEKGQIERFVFTGEDSSTLHFWKSDGERVSVELSHFDVGEEGMGLIRRWVEGIPERGGPGYPFLEFITKIAMYLIGVVLAFSAMVALQIPPDRRDMIGPVLLMMGFLLLTVVATIFLFRRQQFYIEGDELVREFGPLTKRFDLTSLKGADVRTVYRQGSEYYFFVVTLKDSRIVSISDGHLNYHELKAEIQGRIKAVE